MIEIQELIVISLGCISYIRGLFEEINFEDYGNGFKKLKRTSATQRIIEWIELGVLEPISKGYLKNFTLGIYLNPNDPNNILEAYTFDIKYDKQNINLNNLSSFCLMLQHLDYLPYTKYLTIRLIFNSSAPKHYQPMGFKYSYNGMLLLKHSPLKLEAKSMLPIRLYNLNFKLQSQISSLKSSPNTFLENMNVRCLCCFNYNDSDMIMCDQCLKWHHTVCCGFFSNTDKRIPKGKYICLFCRNMWNKEVKKLAIFRKVLSVVYTENICDSHSLSKRLSLNFRITNEIVSRMAGEELISELISNNATCTWHVVKNEKSKQKIKFYFNANKASKLCVPISDIELGCY